MHSAPRIRLVGGALVGAESHWYEAVDHVAWHTAGPMPTDSEGGRPVRSLHPAFGAR